MITLCSVFVLTILLGVPVAFCLGLAGLAFILVSGTFPLDVLPTVMFSGVDSFPLMAIPFFIMAGDMMSRANVLPKLVDFADSLVGHLRGGLAYVNIVACMFFAGVTGVAVADAAAVGSMLIPGMVKQGYTKRFSAAVTASAAIMGPIIPPSVAMVIFAYVYGGGISVAKMFLAGVVPGVMIAGGLMAVVFVMARLRGFPLNPGGFSFRHMLKSLRGALLGLVVPIIILGGIIGGIFTPTEAGAVAVGYSVIVGVFVTRTLKWKDITESLYLSAKTSAIVFLMLSTAKIVSFILTVHQVPMLAAGFFQNYISTANGFLFWTVILLVLLGFVLEGVAIMIMLIPVFGPLAVCYGIDPHLFGLVLVMTVQIALITPPVAVGLFIVTPIAGCSVEEASREILPFLLLLTVVVLTVSFFPDVALWLPKKFGY
ncbi:MAG: TRAP transporter large permease [Syntrophobacteraceae bacterium]